MTVPKVILSQISLEELTTEIKNVVESAIRTQAEKDLKDQLLSPAETCKLFQPTLSKTTLTKWTRQGLIPEHRIGGRVYYKNGEVMQSLQSIKRYRRNLA